MIGIVAAIEQHDRRPVLAPVVLIFIAHILYRGSSLVVMPYHHHIFVDLIESEQLSKIITPFLDSMYKENT